MDYLVLDAGYNFGNKDTEVKFATNDKAEAIEPAKDVGAGTVVLFVDKEATSTEFLPRLIRGI